MTLSNILMDPQNASELCWWEIFNWYENNLKCSTIKKHWEQNLWWMDQGRRIFVDIRLIGKQANSFHVEQIPVVKLKVHRLKSQIKIFQIFIYKSILFEIQSFSFSILHMTLLKSKYSFIVVEELGFLPFCHRIKDSKIFVYKNCHWIWNILFFIIFPLPALPDNIRWLLLPSIMGTWSTIMRHDASIKVNILHFDQSTLIIKQL